MKLTPPKVITFWISTLLGVLGFIGFIAGSIPLLDVMPSGFFLLVLSCLSLLS